MQDTDLVDPDFVVEGKDPPADTRDPFEHWGLETSALIQSGPLIGTEMTLQKDFGFGV